MRALLLSAALVVAAAGVFFPRRQPPQPPALVLWITIDQLRGDTLESASGRLVRDGLGRLLREGLHYTDAHYRHAVTTTAAGHATLFTGAHPAAHGVVGNVWREGNATVYCVGDAEARTLGVPEPHANAGASAHKLLLPTVGDELVAATDGRARVFAISGKDRGAVLAAGGQGKAWWYHPAAGGFVTSSAQQDTQPEWAAAWNAGHGAQRFAGAHWELLRAPASYLRRDHDDRAWERPAAPLGRRFPHPLGETEDEARAAVRFTPFGDELAVAFALELVRVERLGSGAVPDLLALSLSSSDYVGHQFGPGSLEAEDCLYRLDAQLALLFEFLDDEIGMDRVLVLLSADHGVDASPESRHALSCEDKTGDPDWIPRHPGEPLLKHRETGRPCCATGRLYPVELLARGNAALRREFGFTAEEAPLAAFWHCGVFLDEPLLRGRGVSTAEAEEVAARELARFPGVALAVPRSQLVRGEAPAHPFGPALLNSVHPERSPHVMLVPEAGHILTDIPTVHAAVHGTPYAHDTHVPLLLAGPGVPRGSVSRRVGPESLAPTVAVLLGIPRPAGAVGELLTEALEGSARPAE